ncbi:MAG: GNAT family N-acetyltransferase [Chloroflexota bacterium]
MNILETERLILRRFTMDDLDEIYHLVYADPIVKNAWSGAQGTPEELKERFANTWILPQDDFRFRAVVLKETNTLIGLMGFQIHESGEGEEIYFLHSEDEPNRRVGFDPNFIEVELTYALGHGYWKRGYATEMGKAIIPYGFKELGIGRIIQGVRTSNPNSVNLMRRLGFRIEKGTYPNQTVGILDSYQL